MILQGLAGIFVALFNLFLGISILRRNHKGFLYIVCSFICFCFFLWSSSLTFYQFPLIGTSLLWIKLTFLFVTFYTSLVLQFSFLFPRQQFKKAMQISYIWQSAYILISLWMLFLTPYFVKNITTSPSMGIQTILGPAYVLWSIATWVPFIWASGNLIFKTRTAVTLEKIQMKYLWISFITFAVFVCIPDVAIPIIWHDTRYFYISSLTNLVFSGTIAYLILRHRFLDIRRIITLTITRGVILLGVGIIYFAIAYGIGIMFFSRFVNLLYIFGVIVFVLLVRMVIQPLERELEKRLQKIINVDLYDREDVVNAVSRIIATTTDFTELTQKITEQISQSLGFSQASILRTFPQKKQLHFYFAKGEQKMKIPKEYYLIEEVVKSKLAITDELGEGLVKSYFERRKVGLVAPLKVKGELFGYLVLYRKTSGNIYTDYDVKTIEIIIPQISVALQNSLHIEEIEKFNQSLKQEIKKATEELRLANKKLIELDRQKDDFIGMASHELRTPTTVIKTFLWILYKKEKSLNKEVRGKVEKLYHLSSHLGDMIKEMLDVSLIESGKMLFTPEKFNITQFTKEIIDGIIMTIPKEKQINLTTTAPLMVYADKAKIHQVMSNLITNAIKYSSENGKVIISFSQKDATATIMVQDDGIGIDKKHAHMLFTKFGKVPKKDAADKEIPGSGLGLYISKEIIKKTGGNMWVESEVGKGSTFFFTLPINN